MLKGFVAMAHPSRVTNAQNLQIATGSPRSIATSGAVDAPSWALTRIPNVTAGMRRLVRRFGGEKLRTLRSYPTCQLGLWWR